MSQVFRHLPSHSVRNVQLLSVIILKQSILSISLIEILYFGDRMSFYFNIHNPLLSAPTHLTSLTCPPATYTVLHSSCIKTFVVPQRCGDVRQSSLSFYVLFSLSFSVELLLKVLHLFCFPTAPCTISLIAFVMLSSNYCYIYLLFNSIEHPLRTGTIS